MKKIATLLFFLATLTINAQAFIGKADSKFQVGANIQNNGTGLNLSYDYGLGESFSVGVSSTYLLGVKKEIDAEFKDKFDIRARFNANLGTVLNIDENFDVYPGLSLGLKNFGGHLGARYFFGKGFGLYTEFGFPIAKYDSKALTTAEKLNNQVNFNIGMAFSID